MLATSPLFPLPFCQLLPHNRSVRANRGYAEMCHLLHLLLFAGRNLETNFGDESFRYIQVNTFRVVGVVYGNDDDRAVD